MGRFRPVLIATLVAVCLPALLFAQGSNAAPAINQADTAWMLTSTALVLLMTPALAFFYGGLVRSKNALNTMMMSFISLGFVGVAWALLGYSLAFTTGNALIGDLSNAFLNGVGIEAKGTIPHALFMGFQGTFAIITAALISGSIVERMRFSAYTAFITLWVLAVYAPIAHWVWGGGWLAELGTLDYAGGIVVHTTAGVSSLVIALLIGRRNGFPHSLILPHSPALTMIGAGMLWVGWFGFNGGSAMGAGDGAASAILNTHFAACAAALAWIAAERIKLGKSTTVGIATGAVAGLATITPAAGMVGPLGAMAIGGIGGLVCFGAVILIRQRLKIDDSLDVFAIHGVGGIIGSLLLAPFASEALGGAGYDAGITPGVQFVAQLVGVGAVALWSAIATLVLALIVSVVTPMRVSIESEREGLDISSHGERAWEFD